MIFKWYLVTLLVVAAVDGEWILATEPTEAVVEATVEATVEASVEVEVETDVAAEQAAEEKRMEERMRMENDRRLSERYDTMEKSVRLLGKASEGMVDNVREYVLQYWSRAAESANDYLPHIKPVLRAIPAKAYHKLALNILKTQLRQCQHHCGKVHLEYNPIHPGLSVSTPRQKRDAETERMTLAKFGQTLSVFAGDVDKAISEYLKKSVPMACSYIENGLKEIVWQLESLKPDVFKQKMLWLIPYMDI